MSAAGEGKGVSAAQRLAGERGPEVRKVRKGTAENRESEQRRGLAADGEAEGKCGKSAEELRNCGNATLSPTLNRTPKPRPPRPDRAFLPGASVPVETSAKITPAAPLPALAPHEDAVIAAALAILFARLRQPGAAFDSPGRVRDFLALHLAGRDTEGFAVMYLDAVHALIAFEVPFVGTLSQTSVYPREIVRRALHHNAAAVVFAHNHPSGQAEPSRADEFLTQTLKAALALVDVRTLDHLVIAGREAVSFAERGLM